jgi:hypothetical protein
LPALRIAVKSAGLKLEQSLGKAGHVTLRLRSKMRFRPRR